MLSIIRTHRGSRTSLGALIGLSAVLAGCTGSERPEDSVAQTGVALTTTTVSFQQGTKGYAGTIDTQIAQRAAATNYGTSSTLLADGDEPARSGLDVYALLSWDLAAIPADATVSAVTLTFRVTDSTTGSYSIYALKRAWDEATATWNAASSSTSWQTSGARGALDRDATAIATLSARSTGSVTVTLTSYGVSLVNGWVSNPAQNFGVVIANPTTSDSLKIASSENQTVSYRPKITLTYSTDSGGGTGGAGGMGGAEMGGSPSGGTDTGGTSAGGTGAGGTGTGGADKGGSGGSETAGSPGGGGEDHGGSSQGGAETGGSQTAGSAGAGGTTGTGGNTSFGFFVLSDANVSTSSNLLETAVGQMRLIDSAAIGAFHVGDFTDTATNAQWDYHLQFVSSMFEPTLTDFGTTPRYLGAVGNHDITGSTWYAMWTDHLSGQAGLGQSGTDGVYYSVAYRNALFLVQDSEHVSGSMSSYADAQTAALASALAGSTARFKFLFFHEPVYSCNTTHPGFAAGLPWLDLAEKNQVDVVFTGHTHVYTRTCRMKQAVCTTDGTGTVQVEVGSVGASGRTVNVTTATVSGTDATGQARADSYNCNANLKASRGSANDFCYVRIDGNQAAISCYLVQAGNTAPFDSWQISHE